MDFVYDIETYPNVFTLAVEHVDAPLTWQFEISPWRDDSVAIVQFIHWLANNGHRLVGFNNVGFDYPVVHMLARMGRASAQQLYEKAQAIFGSQDDNRWLHRVQPSDRIVPQIDLFLIHHFDNKARATSLKTLEFNMRSDNVSDLPFPPGTVLTQDQVPVLRRYNAHDVSETKRFYHHTKDMIRFREELCVKYPEYDWLNFNDTKIGKQYFTMRLEQAGIQCYEFGPEGRKPRQTKRPSIALRDAILPWIKFEQPEFQRVLEWLKAQTITETKGVFKDVTATINGFTFVFGTGGIHGSVENRVIESDEQNVIIDLDVSSYYPNLAIANQFYPAHLGAAFCSIYKALYEQRMGFERGTTENAMLKLALNGVYGDSNNPFSAFYDPLFTMSITLNGQLLLCLLAEQLMKVPGLELVQINTDGLTVRKPRNVDLEPICQWWQQVTGMTLERAIYKRMFVSDVNNYIGEYEDGKTKRKGAYEYKTEWHQNASALVIPKVAELVLTQNVPIRQTIESWPDKMDFMMRVKVNRGSRLVWNDGEQDHPLQNTTRYYVAKEGVYFVKIMPPLKGKTEERRIAIESGWRLCECNDIRNATLPIDHDYYVQEVEKLVLGLK